MWFIRRFVLGLVFALVLMPLSTSYAQSDTPSVAAGAFASGSAGEPPLPNVADVATQKQMIWTLVYGTFFFVGICLVTILGIAFLVRTAFWHNASKIGPAKWRNYLMQLPLGAPEGSVRALLSMFVVVFGLLVIALQGYLRLGNVEAIAGFVGSVITFYFTSRSGEQARKSALQAQEMAGAQVTNAASAAQAANTAGLQNAQVNAEATHSLLKDTLNAVTDFATNAVQANGPAVPPKTSFNDSNGTSTSNLLTLKNKLTDLQQVARGVESLGVGSDALPNVMQTLAVSQSLLDRISLVLNGSHDAATITKVLQDASSKLPELEASGLPGVLAEAVQVLGDVATPIVAGLPAGPIGIVGGVLVAAIRLASDRSKLNDFQAAILGPPFDPVLLPDTADASVAPAVLDKSPLMGTHFANADSAVAMQLMSVAVGRNDDGSHRNAIDLMEFCTGDVDTQGSVHLPPRSREFVSHSELVQAFDEYLGVLVRMGASEQLSGSVTVPTLGGGGGSPIDVDLRALADAASRFVTSPKDAAELERVVYLGEALGKLPINPDDAVALVIRALDAVVVGGLVQSQATQK